MAFTQSRRGTADVSGLVFTLLTNFFFECLASGRVTPKTLNTCPIFCLLVGWTARSFSSLHASRVPALGFLMRFPRVGYPVYCQPDESRRWRRRVPFIWEPSGTVPLMRVNSFDRQQAFFQHLCCPAPAHRSRSLWSLAPPAVCAIISLLFAAGQVERPPPPRPAQGPFF